MARKKLTKKRAKLLAELEQIVGNNCYNGSIQNYGPYGVYEGAGRYFRYPLTVSDAEGNTKKVRSHREVDPNERLLPFVPALRDVDVSDGGAGDGFLVHAGL